MWVKPGIDLKHPEGRQDDTHLQESGAIEVAKIVANEIKKQGLKDIAEHVITL